MNQVMNILQGADGAPTVQATKTAADLKDAAANAIGEWKVMKTTDVATLNAALASAKLPAIAIRP